MVFLTKTVVTVFFSHLRSQSDPPLHPSSNCNRYPQLCPNPRTWFMRLQARNIPTAFQDRYRYFPATQGTQRNMDPLKKMIILEPVKGLFFKVRSHIESTFCTIFKFEQKLVILFNLHVGYIKEHNQATSIQFIVMALCGKVLLQQLPIPNLPLIHLCEYQPIPAPFSIASGANPPQVSLHLLLRWMLSSPDNEHEYEAYCVWHLPRNKLQSLSHTGERIDGPLIYDCCGPTG